MVSSVVMLASLGLAPAASDTKSAPTSAPASQPTATPLGMMFMYCNAMEADDAETMKSCYYLHRHGNETAYAETTVENELKVMKLVKKAMASYGPAAEMPVAEAFDLELSRHIGTAVIAPDNKDNAIIKSKDGRTIARLSREGGIWRFDNWRMRKMDHDAFVRLAERIREKGTTAETCLKDMDEGRITNLDELLKQIEHHFSGR
jgi:hypothetical protein